MSADFSFSSSWSEGLQHVMAIKTSATLSLREAVKHPWTVIVGALKGDIISRLSRPRKTTNKPPPEDALLHLWHTSSLLYLCSVKVVWAVKVFSAFSLSALWLTSCLCVQPLRTSGGGIKASCEESEIKGLWASVPVTQPSESNLDDFCCWVICWWETQWCTLQSECPWINFWLARPGSTSQPSNKLKQKWEIKE